MAKLTHSRLTLLSSLLLAFLLFPSLPVGVRSATMDLFNNCDGTVWPGLTSNAGNSLPSTTGFALEKGQSKSVSLPPSWSGRVWARTLCATDGTGRFSCATADCGSGKLECSGGGATPPATLAEFTFGSNGGMDFYDVSLVDGFNVPIAVAAKGSPGGNCSTAGCWSDVNGLCPGELRVVSSGGEVVACKSACDAFGSPEYCCSGSHANPNTCQASSYSNTFKKACPDAYSYAYDDSSSTFTCTGANGYLVTFCPSGSSGQRLPPGIGGSPNEDGGRRQPAAVMAYFGGGDLMDDAGTLAVPSLSLPLLTLALVQLLGCLS